MSDAIFIGGPLHGQVRTDFGREVVKCADAQEYPNLFDVIRKDDFTIRILTYERRRFGIKGTQRRYHYMVLSTLNNDECKQLIDTFEAEEFAK